jgi:hypothetical protein
MSLIRKSDVKNHLSTGSGTSAHLRESVTPPAGAPAAGDKNTGAQGNAPRGDGSASTVAPGSKDERTALPASESDPAS